jgi:hypothetical protein
VSSQTRTRTRRSHSAQVTLNGGTSRDACTPAE